MSGQTSTRRLLITTAVGGILFGAITSAWRSIRAGGIPAWDAVLVGLASAILVGGSLFLVSYFGFVRPRQVDHGPPGFSERRVRASERIWGDGRPAPVWLQRFMWAGSVFFSVMALLSVGLTVAPGTVRPAQAGTVAIFAGFAVLTAVVARRSAPSSTPYSTSDADQS